MDNEQWVIYSLLNYLFKRPAAKDTFQGIAEWWIFREQASYDLERISRALNLLVSQNFVIVKHYSGQEEFYQVNEEKLDEIEAVLEKIKSGLKEDKSPTLYGNKHGRN